MGSSALARIRPCSTVIKAFTCGPTELEIVNLFLDQFPLNGWQAIRQGVPAARVPSPGEPVSSQHGSSHLHAARAGKRRATL